MNTAAKRYSAIGTLLPFLRLPPLPDGSIDQADRQTLTGMYGGILAGEAVAPPAAVELSSSDLQGILRRVHVTASRALAVTAVASGAAHMERDANGIVRAAHDQDTDTLRVVFV